METGKGGGGGVEVVGDTDVEIVGLCTGAGGSPWVGTARSAELGVVGGRERGEGACDDVFGGARQVEGFPLENPSMAPLLPSMGDGNPTGGARTGAARTAEGCVVSRTEGGVGVASRGCTGAIGICAGASGACTGGVNAGVGGVGVWASDAGVSNGAGEAGCSPATCLAGPSTKGVDSGFGVPLGGCSADTLGGTGTSGLIFGKFSPEFVLGGSMGEAGLDVLGDFAPSCSLAARAAAAATDCLFFRGAFSSIDTRLPTCFC
jgi:hypothetical protein